MEEKMESNEPEKKDSGSPNYWIAGVVALIVVVGIIWYAGARKNPAPAGTSSQNGQKAAAVIEYTDSGFSPQTETTVRTGETVEFKNASSGGMWVASAPHPVHTDYPGFDALKAYEPGESYFFTFDKVGTWKFHNHADPTKFGSVTVQ